MAISIRDGEQVKLEVQFHWSAFIPHKLWLIVAVADLVFLVNSGASLQVMFFNLLVFLGLPVAYKWLQNNSKKYIVTNQRVYIEEGIFSKSMRDIPLVKINDVSVNRGMLQRIVGAGNVSILTGNDKPTQISDIDNSEDFKNAIGQMMGKAS